MTALNDFRQGTTKNNADGEAYALDPFGQLRRFLILGTEGGTYYVGQRDLTAQNVGVIAKCVELDARRTVDMIVEVSDGGLAPKNDQAIFALAFVAGSDDPAARAYALAQLPKVCRIGTHLFQFAGYVEKFRGWGRGLRTAVASWYTDRSLGSLETQLAKYQSRNGWSNRDLLRLSKPVVPAGSATSAAFGWAVGKDVDLTDLPLISAMKQAHACVGPSQLVRLIEANPSLTWEMVPSEMLKSAEVWAAFLPNMGLTAVLRNLGRMASLGLFNTAGFASKAERLITSRLTDVAELRRARIHPMAVLIAHETFKQGHGAKGSLTWNVSYPVIDALNAAFELAFQTVEPAGKNTLVALDVSGSMSWENCAGAPITPAVASAAMALITAKSEPHTIVTAFSTSLRRFSIGSTLAEAVRAASNISMGGTDCGLPAEWAAKNNVDAETIVIYTDCETWAGRNTPYQNLVTLRQKLGHDVKQIVVGMTSTGFTIADPKDRSSLDVVGFDASAPAVMANFSAGRI